MKRTRAALLIEELKRCEFGPERCEIGSCAGEWLFSRMATHRRCAYIGRAHAQGIPTTIMLPVVVVGCTVVEMAVVGYIYIYIPP